MITALVILLVVIAVTGIIGGMCMMMEKDAGFLSRYMGCNAIDSGFKILVSIVPELIAAIADSSK